MKAWSLTSPMNENIHLSSWRLPTSATCETAGADFNSASTGVDPARTAVAMVAEGTVFMATVV